MSGCRGDGIIHETRGFDAYISQYTEDLKKPSHRFQSWDHCFSDFNCPGKQHLSHDYLARSLAFYLASWGMYRGSSQLLNHSYTVHLPIIPIIQKECYDDLRFPFFDNNLSLIENLPDLICNLCKSIHEAYKDNFNIDASPTLLSKIILGTFGCMPAFDRFFKWAITGKENGSYALNKTHIQDIISFCNRNMDLLHATQMRVGIEYGKRYPLMKLLDMYLWQKGMEIYIKNKQP